MRLAAPIRRMSADMSRDRSVGNSRSDDAEFGVLFQPVFRYTE